MAVSLSNGMFTLFMNIFRGCFHTCMAAFIMKILCNDIAHIKYKCFEMVDIKPLMRFQKAIQLYIRLMSFWKINFYGK